MWNCCSDLVATKGAMADPLNMAEWKDGSGLVPDDICEPLS